MDTESKVTIVFPMAGKGSRFGYEFKPFLKFCGKTFIENAVEPFIKHKGNIEKIIFIFTEEQEQENKVKDFLSNSFGNFFNIEFSILPNQTDSQYQTVYQGIKDKTTDGSLIICDCDHRVNVDRLFRGSYNTECVVPVWKIEENEVVHWSVIGLDEEYNIVAIAEKSIPEKSQYIYGCIGCILFKDALDVTDRQYYHDKNTKSISQIVQRMIEDGNVSVSEVYEGYFFGDQEKLNDLENERASLLMSAKPIMNINGGSIADTDVVRMSGGQIVVRKSVSKDSKIEIGYTKLVQQYRKMRLLYKMMPNNVAQPIHEFENDDIYFYDIEYLVGYKELDKFSFSKVDKCLRKMIKKIRRVFYEGRNKTVLPIKNSWLNNHLDIKIFQKLDKISNINKSFNAIINGDLFTFNGFTCYGIRHSISMLEKHCEAIHPKFLSVIHGDLTLSNIMYNEEDFCLIDCDGHDQFDNPMLDFGKICQSILGGYEDWCNKDIEIKIENNKFDSIEPKTFNVFNNMKGVINEWMSILNVNKRDIKIIAYFYCGLHFIRMVQFRLLRDYHQGLYALMLAGFYLSKALENLER